MNALKNSNEQKLLSNKYMQRIYDRKNNKNIPRKDL